MIYAKNPNPKKSVKVYGRGLRISKKSAVTICKAINNKHLSKGKSLLTGLTTKKRSLNGKYYSNTAQAISDLLRSAEANAEFKGLEASKLMIHASAHKGFTYRRPRRFKMRGQQRKVANVQLVLEQR
jgi:large subunit ribosomal protein L22